MLGASCRHKQGAVAPGTAGPKEKCNGFRCRATCRQPELRRLRQGRRAQEAHLVHARSAAGVPARHLHPDSRHQPDRLRGSLQEPILGHPRHDQHVRRRRHRAHGDLRAQYHALHLGLHHHAADAEHGAVAGGAEEGGRAGAQAAQSIHALPDGRAGRLPGVRHRLRPGRPERRLRAGGARSGPVLPPHHRGDAGGRHHVPDVARRADHGAWRRQRYVAHHHGRDRGGHTQRDRGDAGAVAAGRHLLAAAVRAHAADAGARLLRSSSSSAHSGACWCNTPSGKWATACSRATPRTCRSSSMHRV